MNDHRTTDERCTWTEDADIGAWDTECGHSFCLEDGTPKQNRMKFCCYCGQPLEQVRPRR
jgi:hypothetical protein